MLLIWGGGGELLEWKLCMCQYLSSVWDVRSHGVYIFVRERVFAHVL